MSLNFLMMKVAPVRFQHQKDEKEAYERYNGTNGGVYISEFDDLAFLAGTLK
jgi:hypothetical protein